MDENTHMIFCGFHELHQNNNIIAFQSTGAK